MSETAFDLDAYFARIGYTGQRTPTLQTLREIHRCHAGSIPFENLNPFLGWPVRLDMTSLEDKLVRGGRGGYCFEHNLLLMHALRAMDFSVSGLGARVLYNVAPGVVGPRTHMLLHIVLDGTSYVADAGFGGQTLTDPLQLKAGFEQTTSLEPFRLEAAGDQFVLEARLGDQWRALYRFGLEEQLQVDYEVTSWYLSNHPQSQFVNNLIAARPDVDRRYALRNKEFTVHYLDGRTERRVLASPPEVRTILESAFRIALPKSPDVDTAFERLMGTPVYHQEPRTP
ncbi:MAG TPA: arylamine N-acetyltransferase [Vicinamibacterales bacterium]|jgi:N-hydroxyarylamine O-acetyltransferase